MSKTQEAPAWTRAPLPGPSPMSYEQREQLKQLARDQVLTDELVMIITSIDDRELALKICGYIYGSINPPESPRAWVNAPLPK